MATKIILSFTGNPSAFNQSVFAVRDSNSSYTHNFYKNFITGTPFAQDQVKIGATLSDTIDNLLANFISFELDGNTIFNRVADTIEISFVTESFYYYEVQTALGVITFSLETIIPPAPDVLEPIEVGNMSIEIIDTYNNFRPLLVEFTQSSSPRLSWSNSDDYYNAIMASKLTFNMLVSDKADAKFFHLFSGDEKRYKVKVNAIDALGTIELLWQGFILPDLFTEPYTNSAFFPEFTAIDMLSSLKGKTLKPWYYNNRVPIAKLISFCLKETGLNQDIIVAPSIIPEGEYWKSINIPIHHYDKDGKLADCYTILSDVLSSNLLTICSYRGYWFIKGATRKMEPINENCLYFDTNGEYVKLINVVNKTTEFMQSSQLPVISVLTPFKSVSTSLSLEESSNIFPEDLMKLSNGHVKSLNVPTASSFYGDYYNGFYNYFTKNVGNMVYCEKANPDYFAYDFFGAGTVVGGLYFPNNAHSFSEAEALQNYFECKVNPFIEKGIEYDIKIEGLVKIFCQRQVDRDEFQFLNNSTKNCFTFQLFVDGLEIVSNRPSFFEAFKYKMEIKNNGVEDNTSYGTVSYSLKTTFKSPVEGRVTLRILVPIWQNQDGERTLHYYMKELSCSLFSIKPTKDLDKNVENVVATRPINYTQQLDYKLAFTSSKNESILNNFGVLFPVNNSNYNTRLFLEPFPGPRTLRQYTVYDATNSVLTGTIDLKEYNLFGDGTLPHSQTLANKVFDDLFGPKALRNNLFVERTFGDQYSFKNVAGQVRGLYYTISNSRFYFIIDVDQDPELPKNYEPYLPLLFGEYLYYMHFDYVLESVERRILWKVYGFTEVKSFGRTVANAIHMTRPAPMFTLETTLMKLMFPNELILFDYDNEVRSFVPLNFDLDLFGGKTSVSKAVEVKIEELIDIDYE